MIKASRMAVSALLAFGALCLPAYSASAQTLSTPVAAQGPLDCSELPNGEYANPDDPTSFYYCAWGRAHLTLCPMSEDGSRLHWNPALKICDWPQHAGNPAATPS